MKNKIYLYCSIIMCMCSCYRIKDNNLVKIEKLNDCIYKEVYQLDIGSVFTGNTYSYYITDTISFRKHVAITYYDDERIRMEISDSNTVKVYKITKTSMFQGNSSYAIYDTTILGTYNINELIKEGKFDKIGYPPIWQRLHSK